LVLLDIKCSDVKNAYHQSSNRYTYLSSILRKPPFITCLWNESMLPTGRYSDHAYFSTITIKWDLEKITAFVGVHWRTSSNEHTLNAMMVCNKNFRCVVKHNMINHVMKHFSNAWSIATCSWYSVNNFMFYNYLYFFQRITFDVSQFCCKSQWSALHILPIHTLNMLSLGICVSNISFQNVIYLYFSLVHLNFNILSNRLINLLVTSKIEVNGLKHIVTCSIQW